MIRGRFNQYACDTHKNVQQGSRISGLTFGFDSDTLNIVGVGVGVKNFLTCNVSSEDLVNKLCDKRLDFWKSLSTFDTFGKGWTNRGNHVREEALKMVG